MEIEQIIQGCLKGDRISQKALFDRYSGKMLAVCSRYSRHLMEAEDLLQDGFIKVFTNLEQYKFEGPFEQWIRRIMINNAIKNLNKRVVVIIEDLDRLLAEEIIEVFKIVTSENLQS